MTRACLLVVAMWLWRHGGCRVVPLCATMTSEAAVAPGAPAPAGNPLTLVHHLVSHIRDRAGLPALYTRTGERWIPINWGRAEWHTADAALLITGCCTVPVYQTVSAEEAQYVLNHSETRVAFVENEHHLAHVMEQRAHLPHLTPTLKVKRRVVAAKYADQIEDLYGPRD
jgi:long-subunit acyl-CoA synthetase (AMP-forming)